jgi:hypothetical protein
MWLPRSHYHHSEPHFGRLLQSGLPLSQTQRMLLLHLRQLEGQDRKLATGEWRAQLPGGGQLPAMWKGHQSARSVPVNPPGLRERSG